MDYDRAQFIITAAKRVKDIAARKAYLDRRAARFYADGSPGRRLIDDQRRSADIAAAIVVGDNATADRLLNETQARFQQWWNTLGNVVSALADAGKPDLAVATEARYHHAYDVNLSDALGRKLGHEVWKTQQLLARALVRCACGPDPLPTVLALPRQKDRIDLAATLYARRHARQGLTSFLTGEFVTLAAVKDKTQRRWIGYAVGLLLQELPLHDIPAAVRANPARLTAKDLQHPAANGMPPAANVYAAALTRAINAGDRHVVAALVKLRPRGDTVWLSDATIDKPDADAKGENILPTAERRQLRMLRGKFMFEHGDARKALNEVLKDPMARAWRKQPIDNEDEAGFDDVVLTLLLAPGAFDLAEDAIKVLRDATSRKAMQEELNNARKKHAAPAAPMDARAILAARWADYQRSQKDSDSRRAFLYAVRDLLAAQPDAFPFN